MIRTTSPSPHTFASLKNDLEQALYDDAWDRVLVAIVRASEHANKLLRADVAAKALHDAIAADRTDVAEALVRLGVDVKKTVYDERSAMFLTPLHMAVQNSGPEFVEFLIAEGAQVDALEPDDRQTPLCHAAYVGNVEHLKVLLQNGANPRAVDRAGKSPLHYAAAVDQSAAVKLLMEHGADPNIVDKDGNTALEIAQSMGTRGSVLAIKKHTAGRHR